MNTEHRGASRPLVRSLALLATVVLVGSGLAVWKYGEAQGAAAGAGQLEPVEVVTEAEVVAREHQGSATSIGTVLATRSIMLRNEIAGTVRSVDLVPGQVVEAGTILVALDVSVEEAEMRAFEARAELAEATLARLQRLAERRAVSAIDLDNGRAERNIAVAEVERLRAVIARKTIRAPFRARIGISDIHPGQFLEVGTLLTTLQGVEDAVNVDFAVAQSVAAGLRPGQRVEVVTAEGTRAVEARIVAVDARVDPATRNATVRARIGDAGELLAPGGSVRVRVPVGESHDVVVVPVSALRKGPAGDHVFVLETAEEGRTRARLRPVQAGPVLGDEVVVLSGLTAGERVAASGSFKLRDAALVSVAGGAATQTASGG
jgi:membrane fusion protein (multidrug efflux system)